MLTEAQYHYLDQALATNPTLRIPEAPYPLNDGHVPQPAQCQVTAGHLEQVLGWGVQFGISWVDSDGLLLPWPHVINWVGEQLIDYSCPIPNPKLAFTQIANDVDMMNQITATAGSPVRILQPKMWGDPLLQQLHVKWYPKLRAFYESAPYL
jgi:hypothetical protein